MQTSGWKLAYTQSECSQGKALCVKALKTATDDANEGRKCLYSLPDSEKKRPQGVNLPSVNEDF